MIRHVVGRLSLDIDLAGLAGLQGHGRLLGVVGGGLAIVVSASTPDATTAETEYEADDETGVRDAHE
jgi:hypothetical protein